MAAIIINRQITGIAPGHIIKTFEGLPGQWMKAAVTEKKISTHGKRSFIKFLRILSSRPMEYLYLHIGQWVK